MLDLRHLIPLFVLVLAFGVGGCGGDPSEPESPDPQRLLGAGRRDAAEWIHEGRTNPGLEVETAIALGYLERLRLGLGSPFRLAEFALRDPRLEVPYRLRLVNALLARIEERQSYQIDPLILDRVGLSDSGAVGGLGAYHLRLIDDAISEAIDPRVGELAVRLAYALAAAEGIVSAEAPDLIGQTASLIRDRELAAEDLRRLIRAAESAGSSPAELIAPWRADRIFMVERPALEPLGRELEREAIEHGLRLARTLRTTMPRLASDSRIGRSQTRSAGSAPRSLLGTRAADMLTRAAAELAGPPRTPVVMAVDLYQAQVGARWSGPRGQPIWHHFLKGARDEEGLVARHSVLLAALPDAAPSAGGVILEAAVGLRTYAQERVWFPGFGGPTARELEDRFGLSSIAFDADMPSSWRPYYRGVLAESLLELRRVLPSLNLRGLSFHFGTNRGGEMTLALHDPTLRTIFLSPERGMGTLAHEVAHDLDWQVALRRYRVRGDYASDRAVRDMGDRLATSVERLTTAALRPPMPGDPTPVIHAQRPAEVFARSVDWFVLVSLAREGRSNGYLTSAQDAMLTGYGTLRPPELTGDAGRALMTILDEAAPVYPMTREWFLQSYGPNRALGPYDLVRRIIEVDEESRRDGPRHLLAVKGSDRGDDPRGISDTDAEIELGGPSLPIEFVAQLTTLAEARESALAVVDMRACQVSATPNPIGEVGGDHRLDAVRRRLIGAATEARARGLALGFAERKSGELGRDWLARRLNGSPWPEAEVDEVVAGFLELVADEVRGMTDPKREVWPGILPWSRSPDRCVVAVLMAAR